MKKILVVHSWGIGDMIMATPMLKSLKLSGYKVDLAIFSSVNKIVLKGNDFVDNIFLITSKISFIKFFKQYDYLVATAGTNPKKIGLLNLFIGAKEVFSSVQQIDVHRIDMNLKIVKSLLKRVNKEPYIYIKDSFKYIKAGKNIGFAVGSGARQEFKRWDIEKYIELIGSIDGNKLVFIGKDESKLKEYFKNLDVTVVEDSLDEVIATISKLDLLVGNDNGLMHIGYATGVNTLTIVGMTNEKETGGYRKNNHHVFLDMSCRPCFNSATDKLGCKTFDCLKDLSVEKVYEKCQQYL